MAGLYIPSVKAAGTAPYVPPPLPVLWERLLGVWSNWDGQWYLAIATAGYGQEGTTAFLPLYPLLVGVLGRLLGGRFLWAGVIIATLCTLGAFVLFYRLLREQYGETWRHGYSWLHERGVLYLAIFPFAFFFWAVYSESLFLLLALGMFYAAGRKNWALAGLALAGAICTRPFGVVLAPCLLWEMWLAFRGGKSERAQLRGFAPGLLIPLLAGLLLIGWSAWALGDPLVFIRTQADWNRSFSWPWQTIGSAFQQAAATPFEFQVENQSWTYLASFLLFVVLAIAGWLRGSLRRSHALYLTLGLLFPLFSATPRNPLLSLPRFELVLFPAFIVLALLARRDWLHYTVLVCSLILQALYLIRFVNWFWVA